MGCAVPRPMTAPEASAHPCGPAEPPGTDRPPDASAKRASKLTGAADGCCEPAGVGAGCELATGCGLPKVGRLLLDATMPPPGAIWFTALSKALVELPV